ncbi:MULTISPECIES: YggS family pyridoxal phosphate-dependent enzyme [unclassified Clostridium]|uniref:YggS family pyridoxal phosphate-dependent enzyme n=1 Tax=unclassified Clostridium TaxID=2614128 RepID=UPI0025C4AA6D|nr:MULTISPECIES: YggS family pyridoxal phosphate-dependent enzyme [unclassified Clostridium]
MSIGHNYEAIMNKISKEITLISVSKTKPVEDLVEAYAAGARDFGENKVQELDMKYEQLPKDIRWHLIGHLQRNKVKYLVGKVHLIHSLDSVRLAEEIEKQFSAKNEIANVLIQINIGREASKTGVKIEELEELINICESYSSIKVRGLMATIPIGNEESCRYYFSEMKKIFDDLSTRSFKNISMEILSMGMTHDYEIAIEEGSNMIRVGEGIFGKRQYN